MSKKNRKTTKLPEDVNPIAVDPAPGGKYPQLKMELDARRGDTPIRVGLNEGRDAVTIEFQNPITRLILGPLDAMKLGRGLAQLGGLCRSQRKIITPGEDAAMRKVGQ